MFGKESAGIPEDILVQHPKTAVRIPMIGDIRSLNLSNSVAIVLYETLRQESFFQYESGRTFAKLSVDINQQTECL